MTLLIKQPITILSYDKEIFLLSREEIISIIILLLSLLLNSSTKKVRNSIMLRKKIFIIKVITYNKIRKIILKTEWLTNSDLIIIKRYIKK